MTGRLPQYKVSVLSGLLVGYFSTQGNNKKRDNVFIPVPEKGSNIVHWESMYPAEFKTPKQLIHKQQMSFLAAAATKYHRPGGLNCRLLFLTFLDVGGPGSS